MCYSGPCFLKCFAYVGCIATFLLLSRGTYWYVLFARFFCGNKLLVYATRWYCYYRAFFQYFNSIVPIYGVYFFFRPMVQCSSTFFLAEITTDEEIIDAPIVFNNYWWWNAVVWCEKLMEEVLVYQLRSYLRIQFHKCLHLRYHLNHSKFYIFCFAAVSKLPTT